MPYLDVVSGICRFISAIWMPNHSVSEISRVSGHNPTHRALKGHARWGLSPNHHFLSDRFRVAFFSMAAYITTGKAWGCFGAWSLRLAFFSHWYYPHGKFKTAGNFFTFTQPHGKFKTASNFFTFTPPYNVFTLY